MAQGGRERSGFAALSRLPRGFVRRVWRDTGVAGSENQGIRAGLGITGGSNADTDDDRGAAIEVVVGRSRCETEGPL
jgi:hypothetical protein